MPINLRDVDGHATPSHRIRLNSALGRDGARMSKRVVLTVSGVIAADIREQIASGKRPRADYLELARSFNADLLDYAAARTIAGRTGRVLEKLGWSQSGSRLRLLEDPQKLSGDCHRWRAGWAAFGRASQVHTRHAAAPFDDRACHFRAEEDRLPGLAGRAKRHRPLHHLQPLATTVHRGTLETQSRPRAMDALHGRPGILLSQTGHARFQLPVRRSVPSGWSAATTKPCCAQWRISTSTW